MVRGHWFNTHAALGEGGLSNACTDTTLSPLQYKSRQFTLQILNHYSKSVRHISIFPIAKEKNLVRFHDFIDFIFMGFILDFMAYVQSRCFDFKAKKLFFLPKILLSRWHDTAYHTINCFADGVFCLINYVSRVHDINFNHIW